MASSRGKSLAKNTMILTIGKISTQAITFFLLPLYTAYLSREDYGIVDLIATIISLLFPIVNMQMEQALFRYMVVNRKDKTELQKITSTAFTFTIFQILCFSLIFTAASPFIHNEYKWFLLINLIFGTINFMMMQFMRGIGDNIGYAVSAFISSLTNIAVNLILILGFGLGADSMLTAMAAGNIISISYIFIRSKFWQYYRTDNFERSRLKELLLYSVPLIPNELSWWAIRASDRFIVTAFLGAGPNGIIAIAHKFPSIYVMLYNIFGIAWTESVVLHLKEPGGETYFSNMTNRMLRIFSCASLLMITVMPFVFSILINKNFDEAYYLIPLYLIGSVFNVVIGLVSTVYIVHKKTKVIAKTSIMAAIICLTVDVALVKFIGIYASPISSIIGFGAMMLYRCIDIKKFVNVNWNYKYILTFSIVLALAMISYYIRVDSVCAVAFILSLVFVYYANKEDMTVLFNVIKKRLGITKP